jgi:hypothetical protein
MSGSAIDRHGRLGAGIVRTDETQLPPSSPKPLLCR